MKKILFLTHNIFTRENPKGYRIQQYFPFFMEKGYKIELLTTGTNFLEVLRQARQTDVVYLQRLLLSPLKLNMLRRLAKKIVYDFDDAIMYGTKKESLTRKTRFKMTVTKADAVLCGNHFLSEEAKKYRNDGIHYIPTVVDVDEYPVKIHGPHKPFVVGWMGSGSTLRYLRDMKNLFLLFNDYKNINFKFVADRPSELEGVGIFFEKWHKDREKASLLSFDVGIMPARDDIWSRGKCGLKLIQYMAAGLPSVTHPVGVANDMIEDGVNGFLRSDLEGWRDVIQELSKNTDLRSLIGKAAREYAESKYSLKRWGPKVVEVVSGL